MAIKLMYITNDPQVARIAEDAGVDRIFVDMEYIGKVLRQGGMDTVQSHHTVEDVEGLSKVLTTSELLVRVNPIHEATADYPSSKEEIDAVIAAGAKILMLPYFKTAKEVKTFVELVGGRAKTMPLIETPEAAACIDEILQIDGIDELFIGLNDLSLGYGMKFMFQLLADGTVERLIKKIKQKNIPYGFGGLASLDGGMLPGRMVLTEHYRLGSGCVILSRSFCNTTKITDLGEIETIFKTGIREIRAFEKTIVETTDFDENRKNVCAAIKRIVQG
ncbi:MAG: aldolase [Clostridia bacterium]|nr:aldolase [Clostridia bacterium]